MPYGPADGIRGALSFLILTKKMVENVNISLYARPLPRVYAIFLFAIEYSAKAQHTTTGGAGGGHTGVCAPVVVC